MKSKVSIITVVLNGESYIEHAINSVLEQSYANIEYLIVDGGSTDSTTDIIKKYQNKISKIISEPDNGISDAFNKGIKLAGGNIIGLVNADDWLEPNAVEKVADAFEKYNPDLVCGGVRFWENDSESVVSYPDLARLDKETSVHHAGVFIKKSLYDSFGLYDNAYRYAMDYELLLRMKMKGAKFYTLHEVVANRRLEGRSYKNRREALKETMRARRIYFSRSDVLMNYLFILIKDTAARILKTSFLRPVYSYYWEQKNKKLLRNSEK